MSNQLGKTIETIASAIGADTRSRYGAERLAVNDQPDKKEIVTVLDKMQKVLFPAHFVSKDVGGFALEYELSSLVGEIYVTLVGQITLALIQSEAYAGADSRTRHRRAKEVARRFIETIPQIHETLKLDLAAAYEGDPAAFNHDEIILSYPGFYAITVSRIAHELHLLGVPIIPRIMTEHAHSLTGIDIHPGATIGKYFFIDHGTGVVIGETTTIGDRVKIYQGVTLGGLSTRAGQGLRNKKRHPTIENDVTIYSGASILGGETVIGEGCIIGGNAFITSSVPPHTRVSMRAPELQFKPDGFAETDKPEYWCYEI